MCPRRAGGGHRGPAGGQPRRRAALESWRTGRDRIACGRSPDGDAHSDLRLAIGALSGGGRTVPSPVKYAVELRRDERIGKTVGDDGEWGVPGRPNRGVTVSHGQDWWLIRGW